MTSILQNIFSVRNDERKIHKIITIAGVKIKFKRNILANLRDNITYILDKHNPLYRSRIKDITIRMRLTNNCNAKCKFCSQSSFSEQRKQIQAENDWLYKWCKPLYENGRLMMLTGGDPFVARECKNFIEFISKNYPHLTLLLESNGIGFNEEYQKLVTDNLHLTHFSINGSNVETYKNACWGGEAGEIAFYKTRRNIENFLKTLKEKNMECFAPSVSMVINDESNDDVYNYIKLALEWKCRRIGLFFNLKENDMKYFNNPKMSETLKMLLEIEKLFGNRVFIAFRLYSPGVEAAQLEKIVDKIPVEELKRKYPELEELVKNRSIKKELEERNRLRRLKGKKTFSFENEFNAFIRTKEYKGKTHCDIPWNCIDIRPDGRLNFCSWFRKYKNIHSYVKNDQIDWETVLNDREMIHYRKNIINGVYCGCEGYCPVNPTVHDMFAPNKYVRL